MSRRQVHLAVGALHPTQDTWVNSFDDWIREAKSCCGDRAYSWTLTSRMDKVTCWSCFRTNAFKALVSAMPTPEAMGEDQLTMFVTESPMSREFGEWLKCEHRGRCVRRYRKLARRYSVDYSDPLWAKVLKETP